MTRTDVVASSRPRKTSAASTGKASPKAMRRLAAMGLALALMLALILPTGALAAEGTLSPYSTTPSTTTSTPTPSTGTSPEKTEKESSTPTKTTAPETTSTTPSTEPTAKKASTLPFTGFDLRWTIAGGVLLMGMGLTIVAAQRRQRRDSGR